MTHPPSFSKLHRRALEEKRLALELPDRLRKRIWKLLASYNDAVGVQRDPNDRWIDNSDVATELLPKLEQLYGMDSLTVSGATGENQIDLQYFVLTCAAPYVFDVVELWWDDLSPDRQHPLQQELNIVFEEEQSPWVFCDRHFFQIDSKFLHEKVVAQTQELLTVNGYSGALQEFVEARNDFVSEDYKGTILNSCKAFESVMKLILGRNGGHAGDLIGRLNKAGILDDLPANLRADFEKKVLQSVPFLRNTLAGHGQGGEVVSVSRELAELCLHLGGAMIQYCIRRQVLLNPPQPIAIKAASGIPSDSDLPF